MLTMPGPHVNIQTKNNMTVYRNTCSTLQIANELRREGKGEEGGGGAGRWKAKDDEGQPGQEGGGESRRRTRVVNLG